MKYVIAIVVLLVSPIVAQAQTEHHIIRNVDVIRSRQYVQVQLSNGSIHSIPVINGILPRVQAHHNSNGVTLYLDYADGIKYDPEIYGKIIEYRRRQSSTPLTTGKPKVEKTTVKPTPSQEINQKAPAPRLPSYTDDFFRPSRVRPSDKSIHNFPNYN